jgi:hypothetical protein
MLQLPFRCPTEWAGVKRPTPEHDGEGAGAPDQGENAADRHVGVSPEIPCMVS